jgi:hypothetical protein
MFVAISSLSVHPAASALPLPAENDPASRAIVASICDLGRILEPLKVCKGRVVDGRIRLRGAIAAGLEAVPVDEVPEEDVTSIILHSLTARRHFTKSALAYIGFPIMEAALAESRRRRLENLKSAQNGVSASATSNVRSAYVQGNTADELAAQIGIGRELFFFAKSIHKKFSQSPKAIRDQWEPKILSGEMGLGQVQQALAGKLAAMDGQTTPKGDAQKLLFDLFSKATVRFGRWSILDSTQRQVAVEKFRTEFLPALPEQLIEEFQKWVESERFTTAA